MIGFLTCKLSFFTRYAENGFTFPVEPASGMLFLSLSNILQYILMADMTDLFLI